MKAFIRPAGKQALAWTVIARTGSVIPRQLRKNHTRPEGLKLY